MQETDGMSINRKRFFDRFRISRCFAKGSGILQASRKAVEDLPTEAPVFLKFCLKY